ncbi:MAG: sialidase family protein, partial [Anaerolineae bacterium]
MNPKRLVGCLLLAVAGLLLLLGLLPGEAAAGTTPPLNLSGNGSYARFPVIARAADGTLCAAWTDNRDSIWNIYFACSTDNGRSWSSPGRVASTSLESLYPTLLFSGTVPLFFWTDTQNQVFTIYQAVGTSVLVAAPEILLPIPRPSVARGNDGSLYLMFANRSGSGQPGDIYYVRRPAGDGAWTTATVVFTHTQVGSMDPRIAAGPVGTL